MSNIIYYEQPLTEVVRACLRLEQLFHQIDHHLNDVSFWGTRCIMVLINNLLQLLDRPDLKTKLTKEMNYQLYVWTNPTLFNCHASHEMITTLKELIRYFIDTNGKIGQSLRELELFSALRLHLMTPGGDSSFDMPMYHCWLQQSNDQRQEAIRTWMATLNPIRMGIMLVLEFIRGQIHTEKKVATKGFYQELLNPQRRLRMIRINLDRDITAYPKISIGSRFLSICFLVPNIEKKSLQYEENFEFFLDYYVA